MAVRAHATLEFLARDVPNMFLQVVLTGDHQNPIS